MRRDDRSPPSSIIPPIEWFRNLTPRRPENAQGLTFPAAGVGVGSSRMDHTRRVKRMGFLPSAVG